jgi:hypothetical protein
MLSLAKAAEEELAELVHDQEEDAAEEAEATIPAKSAPAQTPAEAAWEMIQGLAKRLGREAHPKGASPEAFARAVAALRALPTGEHGWEEYTRACGVAVATVELAILHLQDAGLVSQPSHPGPVASYWFGPTPLTWADVQKLAKRAKIDGLHEGASAPGNVWGCVRRIRARVAEARPSPTREALCKMLESSGTNNVELALRWLLDAGEIVSSGGTKGKPSEIFRQAGSSAPAAAEAAAKPETVQLAGEARTKAEDTPCPRCKVASGKPCLSSKGKLGTGWFHVERAEDAAAQRTLPGQAGKRPDDADPAADERLLRIILKACEKGRARKQVILACRDFPAADVEAGIEQLLGADKLVVKGGGKLQKRGEL